MQSTKQLLWRAAGAALIGALSLPALAQQYGVIRSWLGGDLMPDPGATGLPIITVPRGERVEYLGRDMVGLWWKVRWQGKEGWISRIAIEKLDAGATAAAPPAAATVAPPAAAPAPPPAPVAAAPRPAPVAPAPVALPPAPAPTAAAAPAPTRPGSRGHAVVFGISRYRMAGVSTLPGVPRDMDSASAMAQLMGITADRVSIYREDQVTKAGMAAVLTQLAKEVREGDPVLVYYSGHGSRIADSQAPGRCIEGLLTADDKLLTGPEMQQLLQPLARITDGLFVFFDSCHSGGLSATRATATGQSLRPKFAARSGGASSNCSEIVNMLAAPAPGTRGTGNRYIYAAAARANEISLDDAEKGGLATTNFLSCMARDGGASLTVDAIRACAQAGIEQRLSGERQFRPHHMTITGDLNIRPVRADLSPAFKQQLMSNAASGALSNRPAAKSALVSSALFSQGWPQVANPQQAFSAIAEKADQGSALRVDAPQTLKINSQALQMKVQAPADGFVYVFQASGDGRNAVMLFPNLADRDNRVRAGQGLDLPRASWPLVAGGPEGDNQLLVVFARTERDIGQLVGQEAGPFLDLAVSPTGMQALALAVSRSAHADEPDCKDAAPATRPAYCAPGFSASLRTIREVR